jgi:hypothetical protein
MTSAAGVPNRACGHKGIQFKQTESGHKYNNYHRQHCRHEVLLSNGLRLGHPCCPRCALRARAVCCRQEAVATTRDRLPPSSAFAGLAISAAALCRRSIPRTRYNCSAFHVWQCPPRHGCNGRVVEISNIQNAGCRALLPDAVVAILSACVGVNTSRSLGPEAPG